MPQKKVKNEFISPIPMGKDPAAGGMNRLHSGDYFKNMGTPLLFPQINREEVDGPGASPGVDKNHHHG